MWREPFPVHRVGKRLLLRVGRITLCLHPNEGPRLVSEPNQPSDGKGLGKDIREFFLHRPEIPTLVRFDEQELREEYTRRIAQRVGIDVSQYSVVNIHRIGIEAPVRFVFEEIGRWKGNSPYWPNHVATLEALDGNPEHVRVVLLGRSAGRRLMSLTRGRVGPLFEMHVRTVQSVPSESDTDNARYLLWDCRGGYPMGIFSVYARSPITGRGEAESTQLFFAVGFNPHGRRFLAGIHPVRRAWEAVHNRVTANVLNRFKRICEADFAAACAGNEPSSDLPPDDAIRDE